MMWLGIDESQKYAIVFMGTFAPAVVFVADAARRVDPVLVRAARNLGAGPIAVMWEVVLPGALPSILAALKAARCAALAFAKRNTTNERQARRRAAARRMSS